MSPSLLISGGTVVEPGGQRRADVLVADGVIAAVSEPGSLRGDRVLDADGALVMPGLVDIQVHFRTPGGEESEDIASGARGAALGGVTSCLMMPNTIPTIDNVELVREVLAMTAAMPCDVRTSSAITVGRGGEQLVDFGALHAAGIRVFTDDGNAVASAAVMRDAFRATRDLPGAVLSQHAEDPTLCDPGVVNEGDLSERLGLPGRPRVGEEIIVARDIALARATGGRYHVLHMSTSLALAHVRAAKAEGLRVTAEVTPQHLVLTEDDVERLGTSGKMNPPLRLDEDVVALRAGILDGAIDAVATDHAPHHPSLKARPLAEAPPGMLGVETMASVVWTELVATGAMTPERFVQALSVRPAEIAGISDHGRPVRAGEPANLVVFDPEATWTVDSETLHSKSLNTPWEGRTLTGRVRHTVVRGEAVVTDSDLTAS
jgi:dihydroorotase